MNRPSTLSPRLVLLGFLAISATRGQQVLTDPGQIAEAQKLLDSAGGRSTYCEVRAIPPHFVFSLRIVSGYRVRIAPANVRDRSRKWVTLTKVTPNEHGAAPVYLSSRSRASYSGNGNTDAEIGGAFWVGRGRYTVKLMVSDSVGDVCRSDWQIDARLETNFTNFKMLLEPGQVSDFAGIQPPLLSAAPVANQLTILLHAASVLQMQTRLTYIDKAKWLDAIVALMEELPARSVRLVIFNLEQQKELFRKDDFTFESLSKVADALNALKPAAVDYATAQNPRGTIDFVDSLINQEIHASSPSTAVVFIGPKSIYRDRPPRDLRLVSGGPERFFYLMSSTLFLRSRIAFGAAGSEGRDSIDYAVTQLNGKTFTVNSVDTFAYAVSAIRKAIR